MSQLIELYRLHGTKILGAIVLAKDLIAAALAVEGLVPPEALKWVMYANLVLGILIVRRGYTNTAATK